MNKTHYCPLFCRIIIICVMMGFTCSMQAGPINNAYRNRLKKQLLHAAPDTNKVWILLNLSNSFIKQNAYQSNSYAREAMALSDSLHYKYGRAISLAIMGTNYDLLTDYDQALFCYLQALRIAEELNHVETQAMTLNMIGSIYMWHKKYDVARKYYIESLKLNMRLNLKRTYAISYNNLGIIAFKQAKMKEAIMYYKQAVDSSAAYKDTNTLTAALSNLGGIYTELKDYKTSKYYYLRVAELNNSKLDKVNSDNGLGFIYMQEGDLKRAKKSLLSSKELAENTGNITSLIEIYTNISLLYEKEKDFKQSLLYYRKFHLLSDSIFNEKNAKQINEIQTSYQLEKKNKEIQLLNQTKQINEARTEKEHILRNFTFALLGLIFIISIVVGRNIVLKDRMKNKMLSEKNTLIEKDNAQLLHENTEAKYEVLKSKTNPHFLFNNLTVLSSLIIKDQRSAIQYVEHFSELYRTILKAGEQKLVSLHEEMELVNHYLYVQQVWYKDALKVDVDISDYYYDYLVPSFAIQMLVENAIKHNSISNDDPLTISIEATQQEIIVTNNLQKKSSIIISTFTGQKNITERYKLVSEMVPVFIENGSEYIARLPLLTANKEVTV